MKVFAAVALLMLTAPAEAMMCLSKGEASSIYPRAHLYWSVGKNGRCWETSLARARVAAKGPSSSPPPRRVAEPMLAVPPGSHVAPPIQASPTELEDYPQWKWVAKARDAEREETPKEVPKEEGGTVFSTFEGEPPDVWPVVNDPPSLWLTTLLLMFVLITSVSMPAWIPYTTQRRNWLWMMIRRGSPPYHDMFTRL